MQWSEKWWVMVLNFKELEKWSYFKTIITESLPRERQGFGRRGSSNLRPRPWCLRHTSWWRKGTRWAYSKTPGSTVTNSLTSPHHHAMLLCSHPSCHMAEKVSSLKALSKFEWWGHMKSKLLFGNFFLIKSWGVFWFFLKLTYSTNSLLKEDIFTATLMEDTLIRYEQIHDKQPCCTHKAGNYIMG